MPKLYIPIPGKLAMPFSKDHPWINKDEGMMTIEFSDDETPRMALKRMLFTKNFSEKKAIYYALNYLDNNGIFEPFDKSKHKEETIIIKYADPAPPENIAEWIRRGYPVQLKVEMFIDGKWVDITQYVKEIKEEKQ